MANTYTQIHIHDVFAVQNRICLINNSWKDELYRYISGIITQHNHKLIIINGMPDHIHLLFGMRPDESLSDLIQDLKAHSSKWINSKKFVREKFSWQEGYGGFSYGKSQVKSVIKYIESQASHHKRYSFTDEYMKLLKLFEIEYDERFIFKHVI